jgi:uncharacterized membrane protein YdbT with pleckstrin-like domain
MSESTTTSGSANSIKERKRWLFFGLPFTFTTYTLGGKALTLKRGLFTTTEDDILLFRVMDISIKRTLCQKIFGLGTLIVMSTDQTNSNLEIRNIKRSKAFKEALAERVESERLRMRFKTGELMGNDADEIDVQ